MWRNRQSSPAQALLSLVVTIAIFVYGLRFTGDDKSFRVLWCVVGGAIVLSNLWALLVFLRARRSGRRGVIYTTERHHRRVRER